MAGFDMGVRKKRKCIFIYVNQGFTVRYLLRSGIMNTLKKHPLQIVILSPNGDESIFKKTFEAENVIVEKADHASYEKYLKRSKIQRILIQLRAFVLNGQFDTRTTDDFRAIFIGQKKWTKDYGFIALLKGAFWESAIRILKYVKPFRQLLIKYETKYFAPRVHQDKFDYYMPDMVILSALCGFEFNEFFAREAIHNKVPVCSVILSWDNTSGMGMPGYNAEHIIAWSKNMRKELIELNDIKRENIFVGGVAHFDSYFQKDNLLNKILLFERLGLNIGKKTIFYATKSPKRFPWGPELLEEIALLIKKGEILKNTQVIVRIHPLHYRTRQGNMIFKNIIQKYEKIGATYDHVIINTPKTSSQKIDFDLAESETRLVSSILAHSDVMINMFSTMVLEAAIFQLPSINMCIRDKCKADLGKSRQDIMVDYVQTHNQRVIQTGGVRTVFTMKELCKAINLYLKKPHLDRKKRDIIVENEIGPYPGKAGDYIGTYIVGLLN